MSGVSPLVTPTTASTVSCQPMTSIEVSNLSSSETEGRIVVFRPHNSSDAVEPEYRIGEWVYTPHVEGHSNDEDAKYSSQMNMGKGIAPNVQVRCFLNPFTLRALPAGAALQGNNLKYHIMKEMRESINVVGLLATDSQTDIVAMVGGGPFNIRNGPDPLYYGDIVVYDVQDVIVDGDRITSDPCSRVISRSASAYVPFSTRKLYRLLELATAGNRVIAQVVIRLANYENVSGYDGTEAVLSDWYHERQSVLTNAACLAVLEDTMTVMVNQCVTAHAVGLVVREYALDLQDKLANVQYKTYNDIIRRKRGICVKPAAAGELAAIIMTT